MVTSTSASALPSIKPIVNALAPSPPASKIGNTLCTISEPMSVNMLTMPSAQTVRGILWRAGAAMDVSAR